MLICIFTYKRAEELKRAILSVPVGARLNIYDNGAEYDVEAIARECGRECQIYRTPHNLGFDRFFLLALHNLRERGERWCWFLGDDDFLIEESRLIMETDWSGARVVNVSWCPDFMLGRYREVMGVPTELEFSKSTPRLFFKERFLGGAFGSFILDVSRLRLEYAERWVGSHHLYSGVLWDYLAGDNSADCVHVTTFGYGRGEGVKTYYSDDMELNVSFAKMFKLFPTYFSREAAYVFHEVWLKNGCPPHCRQAALAAVAEA